MKIEQFEDQSLSHFSYAILSEETREIVLVDSARNPQQYYDFAKVNDAKIVCVLETHPHADFVSSHLEIAQHTGAVIRVSKLLGADYAHEAFDEGQSFMVGELTFRALNTPGHSPDSISIVLTSAEKDVAVFTGDTLLIGDVGRPDLREKAGNMTARREELAKQMYHSTREKLMTLADDVQVYPAHGAGSLCSKGRGGANSSSIGAEKTGNYALRPLSEEAFVKELLVDQSFIPKYFGYAVELNKAGAPAFAPSVAAVPRLVPGSDPAPGVLVVDARPEADFKKGHYEGALNVQQDGGKFETWLGSIVGPEEMFYLVAPDDKTLEDLIEKTAKIGYESLIQGGMVGTPSTEATLPQLDVEAFALTPTATRLWTSATRRKPRPSPCLPAPSTFPCPSCASGPPKSPPASPWWCTAPAATARRRAAASWPPSCPVPRYSTWGRP